MQKSQALTGLLVLVSLSAVSVTPAIAEPKQAELSTPSVEMQLAQLLGHETYKKEEQLKLSDYTLGRVRGRAGTLLSIELMDTSGEEITEGDGRVIMSGDANPGDDVLLKEEDGEYEYVSQAQPYWITKLQEDYKWKMAAETKGTALSERTASLWQTLAQNEGRTVTISPLEPAPATAPTGGEYPEAEPVRGMW
jgi:hypothetical protein